MEEEVVEDLAGGRRLIGVPLIALGALLSIVSYRRWDTNERAIRRRESERLCSACSVSALPSG